jgi:hypothetical protein
MAAILGRSSMLQRPGLVPVGRRYVGAQQQQLMMMMMLPWWIFRSSYYIMAISYAVLPPAGALPL